MTIKTIPLHFAAVSYLMGVILRLPVLSLENATKPPKPSCVQMTSARCESQVQVQTRCQPPSWNRCKNPEAEVLPPRSVKEPGMGEVGSEIKNNKKRIYYDDGIVMSD